MSLDTICGLRSSDGTGTSPSMRRMLILHPHLGIEGQALLRITLFRERCDAWDCIDYALPARRQGAPAEQVELGCDGSCIDSTESDLEPAWNKTTRDQAAVACPRTVGRSVPNMRLRSATGSPQTPY
jgi:hypothetical protein